MYVRYQYCGGKLLQVIKLIWHAQYFGSPQKFILNGMCYNLMGRLLSVDLESPTHQNKTFIKSSSDKIAMLVYIIGPLERAQVI